MTISRVIRSGAVIAAVVIGLASCSIDPEDAPRDIAVRDRQDLRVNFDRPAGAAIGSGRIFLLSPEVIGQPRTLQSVARDVGGTPAEALQALFEGPNPDELKQRLRTAIPPGTTLLNVAQDGDELIVDVSSELQQLTGEALIDGVAQIVLTASEISRRLDGHDRDRRRTPAVAGGQRRTPE